MSTPSARPKRARRFRPDRDVEEWHGRYVPYDIVKEFVAAFLVVLLLVLGLAIVLSSPDVAPVTLKSWSRHTPLDFAQTALTELAGTSPTATTATMDQKMAWARAITTRAATSQA